MLNKLLWISKKTSFFIKPSSYQKVKSSQKIVFLPIPLIVLYQVTRLSLTDIFLYDSFFFVLTRTIRLKGGLEEQKVLEMTSTAIRNGNIISLPTETFYALAADPFNLDAVNRIFQIKKRPDWKPLLLLVESIDQARMVTDNIPPVFFDLAETFWPGPLTMILPANKKVPSRVTGGAGTVGIRLLDQTFTRQ